MQKSKSSISERKKFWIFALIYLILTFADMICTYLGTPDLSRESNPLISVFGLGWKALITANIIGYIIYIVVIYISFMQYKRSVVQCEGFKQFISMILYDRPDKFVWIWSKLPNKNRLNYLFTPLGYIMAIVYPITRFLVLIEWIGILSGSNLLLKYRHITEYIIFEHGSIYIGPAFIIVLIIILFIFVYWYYKEYKINKKALEDLETKSNYS